MAVKRLFLEAAAVLLLAQALAPGVTAEPMSLEKTLQLAQQRNPSIAAGRFSAAASAHAARGARALTNPEIGVAPSIVGDAGADSALFFTQPLEINGSRKVRGEIAALEADAACADADALRREVLLQVKQTYYDIVRAQEFVHLNKENLQYLDALRAAVQKQYDVGAVPGSQVIKTEVEMARARQELAQAELEFGKARAAMNTLLNRPDEQDFTPSDSLDFREVAIDRERLRSAALGRRPELGSARSQSQASRSQIRAARLQSAPDLAIQARRGTFESDSDDGIAIAVILPLLDWGSIRAEKRRAEAVSQSKEKQLEAAANEVCLEVEQAIQTVETSSRVVREHRGGIIGKSEELARMARTGYEKGATGYLEVLEAQRTLRSAKTAYYSALADHAKAVAQLEWATGAEPKPEVKR